jgi:hypothetical protein
VKGWKIEAYARRSGHLRRMNLCHTIPTATRDIYRFFQSHPKDRPIQLPLTTRKGMWRIYSPGSSRALYKKIYAINSRIFQNYSSSNIHTYIQYSILKIWEADHFRFYYEASQGLSPFGSGTCHIPNFCGIWQVPHPNWLNPCAWYANHRWYNIHDGTYTTPMTYIAGFWRQGRRGVYSFHTVQKCFKNNHQIQLQQII